MSAYTLMYVHKLYLWYRYHQWSLALTGPPLRGSCEQMPVYCEDWVQEAGGEVCMSAFLGEVTTA